jgi:hypothetical protein
VAEAPESWGSSFSKPTEEQLQTLGAQVGLMIILAATAPPHLTTSYKSHVCSGLAADMDCHEAGQLDARAVEVVVNNKKERSPEDVRTKADGFIDADSSHDEGNDLLQR